MDCNEHFFYLYALRNASEGMLHLPRSKRFIEWVSRYLVSNTQPTHVSVALYDPQKGFFPLKVSAGKNRLPPSLIALQSGSSLVRWFLSLERSADPSVKHCRQWVTSVDLESSQDPLSHLVLQELRRHRTEVCAKIETHDRLAGCLLIGTREDSRPYTPQDIAFFQTLANDIAIEIEREEYFQLSHLDPLTGLLNRYCLDTRFHAMVDRAKESHSEFAITIVDLDHFKQVNDQFGHLVGDRVLKITAEIIQRRIRKSDLVFRYGGDEFLILLGQNKRDPTQPLLQGPEFQADVYQVLERLRQDVASRPYQCFGYAVGVTLSIGVSFYAGEPDKTEGDLIREADQALYASKQKGRNSINVFGPQGST